nr:nucleotide-binding alpha-beta plait domain-containing protein [Tanacetum cinerariifolium]
MVIMGSQRSKEDDVLKISTSIFVTNFPDRFGAKDLWNTCKPYGHVVDTYIPNRRSKAGKRFGFVCFVKIIDVDRLVNNLCTVWVGRLKLHANVARIGDGTRGTTNSFAQVVRGVQSQMDTLDNIPTMVLDDSCLNKEEISLRLMRKVKDFASLTNLKEDETINKFRSSLGAGSWFSQIMQAHHDFIIEERVVWVEVEGVPWKWWSRNTFNRVASRLGSLLNGEELEEGDFHSNRLCICTKMRTVLAESFKMVYRGKI